MPKKSLILGIFLILVIAVTSILAWRSTYEVVPNNNQATTTDTAQATSTSTTTAQTAAVLLDAGQDLNAVASPLYIQGRAKGTWYFEANLPIKLVDANGAVLAQAGAHAEGNWMTADYVPFTATLTFSKPTTATGTLIVSKDNPSGLPQNDASISFPVIFSSATTTAASSSTMITVKLFYQNVKRDEEMINACDPESVRPVERQIAASKTPIQDTIKLLITGDLTYQEKAQGFTTEFPNKDFKLISTSLKGSTLSLQFTEVPGFTSGGSCRIKILTQEIIKTAKQFPDVKTVILLPEDNFQP